MYLFSWFWSRRQPPAWNHCAKSGEMCSRNSLSCKWSHLFALAKNTKSLNKGTQCIWTFTQTTVQRDLDSRESSLNLFSSFKLPCYTPQGTPFTKSWGRNRSLSSMARPFFLVLGLLFSMLGRNHLEEPQFTLIVWKRLEFKSTKIFSTI